YKGLNKSAVPSLPSAFKPAQVAHSSSSLHLESALFNFISISSLNDLQLAPLVPSAYIPVPSGYSQGNNRASTVLPLALAGVGQLAKRKARRCSRVRSCMSRGMRENMDKRGARGIRSL